MLKAKAANFVMKWFFCVHEDMLEQIKQESELRDKVRDEMAIHTAGCGTAAVTECMKEIYNATGHDMFQATKAIESAILSAETPVQLDTQLGELGLTNNYGIKERTQVVVVPKFAASVVLCLRAKFGTLALNEANRLLIEREYLRICLKSTVRNVDVVAHQQCILNAYFMEGVLDQQNTIRARAPRWLREAFGSVPLASAPTVC